MQIDHIKELMELLDQTSIHEMELETSDFKLFTDTMLISS